MIKNIYIVLFLLIPFTFVRNDTIDPNLRNPMPKEPFLHSGVIIEAIILKVTSILLDPDTTLLSLVARLKIDLRLSALIAI